MASPISTALTALARLEGKALQMNPGAFPAVQGGTGPQGSPVIISPGVTSRMSQREAKRHLDAYGGAQAIDVVASCVHEYMNSIVAAESYFHDAGGKKLVLKKTPLDSPDVKVAPDDLVALMQQPNPYQTWSEFIQLTMIDYLMVGNFYWLKWRVDSQGRPLALYRLAPPYIWVLPGTKNLIDGYEYRITGVPEPLSFKPDQVIHGRRPNPHSPYLGLGLIAEGARLLDGELALTDTRARYFENGTKLSGVLQTDRRVPDSVFNKIKAQWKSMYGGTQNAYNVAVLEAGLQFQSIQPTPVESQFQALALLGENRICKLFGMQPEMLGGETRQGVAQDARRLFDNYTMRPLCQRLAELATIHLTKPGWDLELILDYKYIIPEEDQLKNAGIFATLPGVKVVEVRGKAGLGPLGTPEDEVILNLPGPSTAEEGGFADRSLPGEAGRPPLGQNTQAIPKAGSLPGGRGPGGVLPGKTPSSTKAIEDLISDAERALEGKSRHDARSPRTGRFGSTGDPDDAAIAALADELHAGLLEALHPLEGRLFNHVLEGKALKKAERPRLVDIVRDSPHWASFEQAVDRVTGGGRTVTAGLRDLAESTVAEGVRRGYSPKQILDGVPAEQFSGLRASLAHWRGDAATSLARIEARARAAEAPAA